MTQQNIAGHTVEVTYAGAGMGQPLLLIHCSLGRHESLLPLLGAIGPGQEATLFDLPEHGRSGALEDGADLQDVAARIGAALAGSDPFHVIGHSFGATVALRMAIDHPETVGRLTLIEPVFFAAAKGTEAYAEHEKTHAEVSLAYAAGVRMRAAAIFHDLWGDGPWAGLSEAAQRSLAERIHVVAATEPALVRDNAGQLSDGVLEKIDVPVTLIRGADTQPVIAEIHRVLLARLPQAEEHVVEGAAHMAPVTHPRDVAPLIL